MAKPIDPTLAVLLPGKQAEPQQEKLDPNKVTYPKGRFGKITIPASGKIFYSPTMILAGQSCLVLPVAFSTAVHGIENANVVDIVEHRELNFMMLGMYSEEVPIPEAIKNYIDLNKESLKRGVPLCAWDKLL